MNQLNNHKGRFVSVKVKRAKSGVSVYNAKILRVTEGTVTFHSKHDNKVMTVYRKNLVG